MHTENFIRRHTQTGDISELHTGTKNNETYTHTHINTYIYTYRGILKLETSQCCMARNALEHGETQLVHDVSKHEEYDPWLAEEV